MTMLVGTRGQQARDPVHTVTGIVGSGGGTYLVLPEQKMRGFFLFQNLSNSVMYLEVGAGEATATLTSGVVSSITVVNGGFGYTVAPQVLLLGGGYDGNTTFTGATSPGYPPPGVSYNNDLPPIGTPAQAHAVLSGGIVNSIVVDYGGSSYAKAPYVCLINDPNDPNGAADPSKNSGSGIYVAASSSVTFNGTACPTSPVAVYCATSGARWACKFMQ